MGFPRIVPMYRVEILTDDPAVTGQAVDPEPQWIQLWSGDDLSDGLAQMTDLHVRFPNASKIRLTWEP